MTDSIAHRGPDDEGIFIDGSLGLGNRRLAIVDLHPTGHQPMVSTRDGSVLTYNGECYNHRGYRQRLEGKGRSFRGTSDTETVLHALSEWGPSALPEMAGIFAFAWWDAPHQRLLLVRDPLGVKQLYYHDDGTRVVFASEIKALLQDPSVPCALDSAAVNEYLHFHTTLFDRTFFRDIKQVRAGEYVEVSRTGVRCRKYWDLDGFDARNEQPEEGVERLRALLHEVVGEQLMADVPVGAFFSGGIDSSAVAAFAKQNGSAPQCFGVHFSNQGVIDERPYQEAASASLGVDLHLTTIEGGSFPDDLLHLSYYQDQPVIGAAMIPMYYVSKLAARHVKVCLGGQAADETFGGYARYALVDPLHAIRSLLTRSGGGSAAPGAAAPVGGNLLKQLAVMRNARRALRQLVVPQSGTARYFEHFAKVSEGEWQRVLDPQLVSRARARTQFEDGVTRSTATHAGDKVLHWDMQTYLPGLFQQDDRMSMANSLESRVPLADPRLVRFAFHTGFDLKVRSGASKWILRQAVADVIPAHVLNRRKVGFDTPAEAWMKGRHAGFVRDLVTSTAARGRGIWNIHGITHLLEKPDHPRWFDVMWKVASIEAWARTFLDRSPSLASHGRA